MPIESIFHREFNTNLLEIKENSKSSPRIFNVISKTAKDLALSIEDAIQSIFIALGQIRADACAFGRSLRFCSYTLFGIEKYLGKPGFFGVFTGRYFQMDGFIDTINVFETLHYFVTGKFQDKNENIAGILGNIGYLTAGGLGILLFLDEMTALSLAGAAASLGNNPVFGLVAQLGISLSDLALGTVIFSYGCFGVSAIIRLVRAHAASDKSPAELARDKRQAWLDLAWSITEVALKTFIITGGTSLIGLAVLGTIATGFGIASFLHSKQEKAESSQPSKKMAPIIEPRYATPNATPMGKV